MKPLVSALAAMSMETAHAAPAASAERKVSIVLVHGAFVDGSGWKNTYDILSDAGYEVLVVQQTTIALRDDVKETERVIAKARHPVILVGHSKVRSLVYLAAFAPDAGESVRTLAEGLAPAGEHKAPLVAEGHHLLVDRYFDDAPLLWRSHFSSYEIFASQADFDAHNAMPYVQEWFAKLPELAEGGVEVMRMAILSLPKK